MTWGLASAAILAFLLAFTSHSPGWMGFCVFIGLACAIGAALVFIGRHVHASARPEHMTDRELAALRSTLPRQGDPARQLPPTDSH